MSSIIILSGPVGAGKSTVSRELIKLMETPVICIEGDVFWSFIARGAPGQSGKESFTMTMAAMLTAALPYMRYNYDVIIDFSIPPWFLDTALKIAAKKEVPLHYVVLRPSEAVCSSRSVNRVEGFIEYNDEYRKLYASFDEAQQYVIPDATSKPAEIAAHIKEGLDEGVFFVKSR